MSFDALVVGGGISGLSTAHFLLRHLRAGQPGAGVSPAVKVVEASGGYGEEVTDPKLLPSALERALKAVEVEKRQAVLNVQTSYDDSAALADAKR